MRDIKQKVRDNKLISGIQRLGYLPYEPLSRGCLDFLNNLVAGFSGHSKKNEGRRQNLPVLFRPDLRRSLLPYSTDQTCHRANSDSREGESGSFSWWLHVQRGKNCWSNGALAGHNNSCVPCQRTCAIAPQTPQSFIASWYQLEVQDLTIWIRSKYAQGLGPGSFSAAPPWVNPLWFTSPRRPVFLCPPHTCHAMTS